MPPRQKKKCVNIQMQIIISNYSVEMSANSFNIKAWEEALPPARTEQTPEDVVAEASKHHIDSIFSRPGHYEMADSGPGAVYRSNFARTNSSGQRKVIYHKDGVRGSIEGPPFEGKTYEVVLHNFMGPSRDDDGESQGIYKCVSKTGPVATMVNTKTGTKIVLGKEASQKNNWQSRFWYQNGLHSWVFEEVKTGGATKRKSKSKSRKSKTRRH